MTEISLQELIKRHPNTPLMALWDALQTTTSDELPMTLITGSYCGIERRATRVEEYMGDRHIGMGATPLMVATLAGRSGLVRALVSAGADVSARENNYGKAAIHIAAAQGDVDLIAYLLDNGASVSDRSTNDETPLHVAVWEDHLPAVKYLCSRGAEIECPSQTFDTPLQIATVSLCRDVAEYLLNQGAQVDPIGTRGINKGETPLYSAAFAGDKGIVKLLLAHGASVAATGNDGFSVLQIAVSGAELQATRLLLDNGADVDQRNEKLGDETALHTAATYANIRSEAQMRDVTTLLISEGAHHLAL